MYLLYLLVARYFGHVAGLAAALALAVSPVSVSVNRDNNPDALLVVLLVAAAYAGARAIESGRLRTLLLTAALVGLAFNTKMLAAMVVVPGLALAYAMFARAPVRRRIAYLALAGAVLVAVSGAWIAAVDLTPASGRPYVGSTSDNSALGLALDYNGLGRVTGQTGGTSFGGGLGGAFSGTPGWLRLFNDALGDQGGWLLPLALVGGLSALGFALWRRRRRELAALTVVGGWFVAAAVVFSFSSGIIHTYYLSALAPATSALVGIGLVALWRDARGHPLRLAIPLLALGLSAWVEVMLLRRSGYLPWLQDLVIAGCAAAAAALVAARLPRLPGRPVALGALGVGFLSLLAAPAAWAQTTLDAPVDGVFPARDRASSPVLPPIGAGAASAASARLPRPLPAGVLRRYSFPGWAEERRPEDSEAGPHAERSVGAAPAAASSTEIEAALRYAKAHDPGTRWALIVSGEQSAAPFVIDGESVGAMGGFTGRETVLTPSYLALLVRSGEARYFLLGGTGGFGSLGSNDAVSLVTSTCSPVSSRNGQGSTLYDCAGKAAAIAAG